MCTHDGADNAIDTIEEVVPVGAVAAGGALWRKLKRPSGRASRARNSTTLTLTGSSWRGTLPLGCGAFFHVSLPC